MLHTNNNDSDDESELSEWRVTTNRRQKWSPEDTKKLEELLVARPPKLIGEICSIWKGVFAASTIKSKIKMIREGTLGSGVLDGSPNMKMKRSIPQEVSNNHKVRIIESSRENQILKNVFKPKIFKILIDEEVFLIVAFPVFDRYKIAVDVLPTKLIFSITDSGLLTEMEHFILFKEEFETKEKHDDEILVQLHIPPESTNEGFLKYPLGTLSYDNSTVMELTDINLNLFTLNYPLPLKISTKSAIRIESDLNNFSYLILEIDSEESKKL